jgi:hypothetical protein
MKNSRFILFGTVIVFAGLLFYSLRVASKSSAQDSEKSLDIERNNNEPLELWTSGSTDTLSRIASR